MRNGTSRFVHASGDKGVRDGYRAPEGCRGYSIAAEVVEGGPSSVRAMLEDNNALHRAIAMGRGHREPVENPVESCSCASGLDDDRAVCTRVSDHLTSARANPLSSASLAAARAP